MLWGLSFSSSWPFPSRAGNLNPIGSNRVSPEQTQDLLDPGRVWVCPGVQHLLAYPVGSTLLVKGPLQSLLQGLSKILLCFMSLGSWEDGGRLSPVTWAPKASLPVEPRPCGSVVKSLTICVRILTARLTVCL